MLARLLLVSLYPRCLVAVGCFDNTKGPSERSHTQAVTTSWGRSNRMLGPPLRGGARRVRKPTETYLEWYVARRLPELHDLQRRVRRPASFVGGSSVGDTPVPIPNTAVKPHSADGTAGEARWESTSPPTPLPIAPRELRLPGGVPLPLTPPSPPRAFGCRHISHAPRLTWLPLATSPAHARMTDQ